MQTTNFYTVTDQNTVKGTITLDGDTIKGTGIGKAFIASCKLRGLTDPARIFAHLSDDWTNGHYYSLPSE